ncbi:MAG: hypothetical protein WDO73_06590 [Ignavibacteriota bacterium]
MRRYLLLIPVLALAQGAPAGTEVSIRLTSAISTQFARASDTVEAVAIAPVLGTIPAGAVLRGTVEKVSKPAPGVRATLLITFHRIVIAGKSRSIAAQVATVDNAREKVDESGQVVGILASETLTGQLDAGLDKLSDEYSGLGSLLSAAKRAVLRDASTDISYPAGTEMTLRLTKALLSPPVAIAAPPAWSRRRSKCPARVGRARALPSKRTKPAQTLRPHQCPDRQY